MPYIRSAYRLYRPYVRELIVLIVLGFVSAILDGISINMLVPFISFLTGGSAGPLDIVTRTVKAGFDAVGVPFQFRNILILMAILFIVRAAILSVFSYISARIGISFIKRQSSMLLKKTLSARWSYLLTLPSGYTMNTIFWDVKRASALLGQFAQTTQSLSGCLVYIALAFVMSPLITGITLVAGVVFIAIFKPLIDKTRIFAHETSRAEKLYSQHIIEHLGGLKTVKARGAERPVEARAEGYLERLRHAVSRSALVQSLSTSLVQPFGMLFILGLFMITYQSGSFNIATFAATVFLIQKIFTYLQSGQAAAHGIIELAPYVENVVAFDDALTREAEPAGKPAREAWHFEREVEFKNVSFAYPNAAATLDNVSFSIPKGKTVAIIGPSGSGKTTTADLMLRLFEPTGGTIRFDGLPIADVDVAAWRASIGYVPQDIFLLNETIAEGIRFYRDHITDEEVEHAARQAHIYDFIMGLPDGFATKIGERGVMLSGGQRQRIALARALAGNPELLILDEATSALDTESERYVQEAIEGLHGKMTVLIIAHRLSTIERADRIIVLDKGHILEEGSPDELRKRPDSYFARNAGREKA